MELAISFVIAVMVLRGFLVEGYLISTGSMAPHLLGFHKKVECPDCSHVFAFGVSFDESATSSTVSAADSDSRLAHANCPNCGRMHIKVATIPGNHGDQLLVHKGVFDFREPKRWETVVFRNPGNPGEAYVKRVVGLPDETLRIIAGDLYVGGAIARKDLATQIDMRIPVFNIRRLPDSVDWELPWDVSGNWKVENGTLSTSTSSEPVDQNEDPPVRENWLHFRNWRRSGGSHTVEVPLSATDASSDWSAFMQRYNGIPMSWSNRIEYDASMEVLRCRGVMPDKMQADLVKSATNDEFRRAIFRLAALSHLSPVTDQYGYNSSVPSPEFPVTDLMIEADVSWSDMPESVVIDIPMDHELFRVEIDPAAQLAKLFSQDSNIALTEGRFAVPSDGTAEIRLLVSNFDHRILVAINETEPWTPYDVPSNASELMADAEAPVILQGSVAAQKSARLIERQSRFGIGILGGSANIRNLQMFRDVYYTPGRRRNGIDADFQVPSDSFFVQGDNSPVSSDSRNWETPAVPRHLLVGKPFIVHLPSRPGKLGFGNGQISIRIPDFERIRYIH